MCSFSVYIKIQIELKTMSMREVANKSIVQPLLYTYSMIIYSCISGILTIYVERRSGEFVLSLCCLTQVT